jgi:hypothetical protein
MQRLYLKCKKKTGLRVKHSALMACTKSFQIQEGRTEGNEEVKTEKRMNKSSGEKKEGKMKERKKVRKIIIIAKLKKGRKS